MFKTLAIASITFSSIFSAAQSSFQTFKNELSNFTQSEQVQQSETFNQFYEELANVEFTGEKSIPVNNDKPIIEETIEWGTISYSDLDELNRSGSAVGFLTPDNAGTSEGRTSQVWLPTGWHQKKVNNKTILDRGHLIAYSLSFNVDEDGNKSPGHLGSQDNPKNLFTQTAQSNQGEMRVWENKVKKELEAGHNVKYKVTPVYNGDDLMAKGAWVQAESKNLSFSRFVFNVTEGVEYDYSTGRSKVSKPSIKEAVITKDKEALTDLSEDAFNLIDGTMEKATRKFESFLR